MRDLRSILVFHPVLWGLVVLQSLVIALWFAIDPRISFRPADAAAISITLGVFFFVGVIAYLLRASRWPVFAGRARVMATAIIFLLLAFTGARFLNYLSMSLALPMADNLLDGWDKALAIDWHAYASRLSQYPDVLPFIHQAYAGTTLAISYIVLALAALGRFERTKEFITLLYVGVLLTIAVAAFFPADGAMARHMDDHLLASFGPNGVDFVEPLRTMRESKDIVLSFANMPGLASFPSFHTIAALLIIYAWRDNIVTLLLAGVGAAAILLGTPIYGGHYFVDVIAGFFVTIALTIAYAAFRTANLPASETSPREALS